MTQTLRCHRAQGPRRAPPPAKPRQPFPTWDEQRICIGQSFTLAAHNGFDPSRRGKLRALPLALLLMMLRCFPSMPYLLRCRSAVCVHQSYGFLPGHAFGPVAHRTQSSAVYPSHLRRSAHVLRCLGVSGCKHQACSSWTANPCPVPDPCPSVQLSGFFHGVSHRAYQTYVENVKATFHFWALFPRRSPLLRLLPQRGPSS